MLCLVSDRRQDLNGETVAVSRTSFHHLQEEEGVRLLCSGYS